MTRVPVVLGLAAALLSGCGHPGDRPRGEALPRNVPVTVLADRPPDVSLPPAHVPAGAPAASLTLVRVAPQRSQVQPPLPEPGPAEPPAPSGGGGSLPLDDALRPPVPLGSAQLRVPGTARGWVELDVRVDERGTVSDALFAAGDADSAQVRAALEAAGALRYLPARRAGRAVAVWSRQRFEFAP